VELCIDAVPGCDHAAIAVVEDGLIRTLAATDPSRDALDALQVELGRVLAAHASVAVASQFEERQLHQALETRTVIGQATGILIERFGLSPDQAFAVMQRVSQHHDVKLHDLAEYFVQTGVLLDPWSTDGPSVADGVRIENGVRPPRWRRGRRLLACLQLLTHPA
jgi:hypothetical protein